MISLLRLCPGQPVILREVDYNYKAPESHYVEEVWKCHFMSVVRPNVKTDQSRKHSFSETVFKTGRIWRHWLCFLVWTENFLKTRWRHDNHAISLPEFTTNPKWPLIVAFSSLSGVVWTENIWCVTEWILVASARKIEFVLAGSIGEGSDQKYD